MSLKKHCGFISSLDSSNSPPQHPIPSSATTRQLVPYQKHPPYYHIPNTSTFTITLFINLYWTAHLLPPGYPLLICLLISSQKHFHLPHSPIIRMFLDFQYHHSFLKLAYTFSFLLVLLSFFIFVLLCSDGGVLDLQSWVRTLSHIVTCTSHSLYSTCSTFLSFSVVISFSDTEVRPYYLPTVL